MASELSLNIDTTKSEFQNPMVQLRQGDGNYQSLSVTVTSNGSAFDLTGWTTTFMGTTAGAFKIIDSAVTVTNALQGEFTYTPTKSWGQDQGEFKNAYFKFTKADETASGASFRVNVLEAVDLTAEEAGNYISVVDVMIDKIKTDMDNKLADTQTTLTNTQSQATTVQGNVNDLNNNVNELKAQNNAIKTTDNTWSGTNTFNKKIIASDGVQGNADTATKLQTPRKINGTNFDGTADINVPASNDSNIVHQTGTETIAGYKTFSGNTSFTDFTTFEKPIQGSLGVRIYPFTTISALSGKLVEYSGKWGVTTDLVTDLPQGGYAIMTVYPYLDNNSSGFLTLQYTDGSFYFCEINSTNVLWKKVAKDSEVMHLTGNETVTGDKSFTGSVIIQDANPVKVKQSATVEFPFWYGSSMRATRFGNMVTLHYSTRTTQDIPANSVSAEAIPLGFRPADCWYMAAGGGSAGSVEIGANGKLNARGAVQYAYTMTATYFTGDAFPS